MRRLGRFLCRGGLILVALLGFAAGAQGPVSFHDIDSIPIDAPIPWGQPLAGGSLSALVIAPYSTMADVALLKAHLEIELEVVATWDRAHLGFDPLYPEPSYPDASYEAVEARLSRALERKKLDLIIIGQCEPSAFPEAIQRAIMARVEAGTGLVYSSSAPSGSSVLASWLRDAAPVVEAPLDHRSSGPLGLPEAAWDDLVRYSTAGSGRIAHLNFSGQPSPNHSLIPVPDNPYALNPEHEANAFSLLCKVLLWAAGRAPENTVGAVLDITPRGPDDEEIPPGYPREFVEAVRRNAFNQPLRPYVLALDAPATTTYDVVYQLRVPGSLLPAWRVPSGTVIPKGETRCALDIIASPGVYFLDIWLTTRKGIAYWHTESIEVTGWPQIAAVTVLQEGQAAVWLHPNDHLDVQVTLEPGAFLTSGEAATVYARAVDSFERQVASAAQNVGPEGGTVTLRLELADLIAPLIRVEVFAVTSALISEAGLAGQSARLTYYFPVRLPEPAVGPLTVLSGPGPFDYGAIRQMAQLRSATDAGILHAPVGAESLLAASAAGLGRLAQVGTLDAGHVGEGAQRVPCLSSAAHWDRESVRIKDGVLASWAGGPPWYSLGAAGALTSTEANVCQAPSCLSRFRSVLRAQYPSLEALNGAWGTDFLDWEAVTPLPLDQCQQSGRWAPWLDFRLAMNGVFAEALERGRAAVQALPGAGGTGFQSPSSAITPAMGYDWRQICGATDFVTVPAEPYAMRRIQSYHGARPFSGVVLGYAQLRDRPEWAARLPWDCVLRQIPAIWLERPFSEGPHNLIGPSGSMAPGFAALTASLATIQEGVGAMLLRAQPHPTGIAIVDNPATRLLDYASPDTDHSAEVSEAWFGDALNQLGYTVQVRSLEASLQGLNTLILARSRVLSDAELAVLEAFHDGGGLILADGEPGSLDAHGVPRSRPPLPFLHPLQRAHPEEAVALWTNRPVWIGPVGESDDLKAVLGPLLARAGNTPCLPIELPEKQAGAVERFQFTYGAATLVACLPQSDVETTVRRASLQVPEGYFGHALLSPEATTSRRRIQWAVVPGEAAVFSLLPYRVEGLVVGAPELVLAGQRLHLDIRLQTGDQPPGDHFVVCRLEGADGVELAHYRTLLNMSAGRVETYIPLAENEAPGYYTLRVSEVLSRHTHEQLIEIQ